MLPLTLFINGHTDSVNCLSLGDRLLASGGDDGNVCLWSPSETPHPVSHVANHGICSSVKFKPGDSNIIYSAHNRVICTWDIRRLGFPVTAWTVNEEEINSIDVLNDEPRLAAADDSGTVQIIDTTTGNIVCTLKKHHNICSVAKFCPGQSWQLISGGLDCRMVLSDWKCNGSDLKIFDLQNVVPPPFFKAVYPSTTYYYPPSIQPMHSGLESHASSVDSAHPETGSPNSSSNSNENRDMLDDEEIGDSSESHGDSDDSMDMLSDSVTSRAFSKAQYIQPEPPSPAPSLSDGLDSLPINPPMVHSIAYSPSGDKVVAGLQGCSIEFFEGNGQHLKHVKSLISHELAVSALHFINETTLLSGGNDQNVFLWILESDRVHHGLTHNSKINALEGRDVTKVYLADCSSTVQMYDLSVY